jgi:hypothetical protein
MKFREIPRSILRKYAKFLAKSFRGISQNFGGIPRKKCFISSYFVFREIARYPFRGHPSWHHNVATHGLTTRALVPTVGHISNSSCTNVILRYKGKNRLPGRKSVPYIAKEKQKCRNGNKNGKFSFLVYPEKKSREFMPENKGDNVVSQELLIVCLH